jgi:hypothetical protein
MDPDLRKNVIENEMYNYRKEALAKLSQAAHLDHIEDIASILYYSWLEGHPAAENLAHKLDISPIDFIAIDKNLEEFERLFIKEKEMFDNG